MPYLFRIFRILDRLNRIEILRKSSSEEIFLEYCTFLSSLPPLIDVERKKVVGIVRKELGIDAIEKELPNFDFESLQGLKGNNLISYLSIKVGFSLSILCPPLQSCLLCERSLTLNNKPT